MVALDFAVELPTKQILKLVFTLKTVTPTPSRCYTLAKFFYI